MNEPIVIQPPVWVWVGTATCCATIGKLRLDVYNHRLGWKWICTIPGVEAPLQDFYTYSDTPEAAQSAAWSALREWLGAA